MLAGPVAGVGALRMRKLCDAALARADRRTRERHARRPLRGWCWFSGRRENFADRANGRRVEGNATRLRCASARRVSDPLLRRFPTVPTRTVDAS
jgi:hypothetical protein